MGTSSVKVALLLAAVLAVLLAGCTSVQSSDDQEGTSSSATSSTAGAQRSGTTDGQGDGTAASTLSQGAGPVDAQRAVQIALAEAPGSVVVEVDEHRGSGVQQWEVVVLNSDGSGTELRIDLATGEVISSSPEGLDPEARTAPALSAQRAMIIRQSTR